MNTKALITTLAVLGSSSVAMARPAVTVSGHAEATITHQAAYGTPAPVRAPIIRDHRAQLGYHHTRYNPSGPFVPMWTTLGGMSQIYDGNMSFAVNPYASRFTTLKLQSSAGKSLIYRVIVTFANGRQQTVELNQYLNASNPTMTIDLAGYEARAITNVTVVGRNARSSAFTVLAI